MKIKKRSQVGRILAYLQNNADKEVLVSDFMGWSRFNPFIPFVGYSAGGAISRLKKHGLVKEVGYLESDTAGRKRMLHEITFKGILFNLS